MIYTWSKQEAPGLELSPPYTDEDPLPQVLIALRYQVSFLIILANGSVG